MFEKGDDEDCEFDTELYYPLSLLFIINTSLQGFLVNVIFLTSPSTFSFWYHRMKNLLTGKVIDIRVIGTAVHCSVVTSHVRSLLLGLLWR